MRHSFRAIIGGVVVLASMILAPHAFAAQRGGAPRQPQRPPVPQGQRIEAHDGDTIVMEDDARVRIVRRRHGVARAIFSPTERWLVVLADYTQSGAAPDGRADMAVSFTDITGDWPFQERWEGDAILEEYSSGDASRPVRSGIGIVVNGGLVQMLTDIDGAMFRDPRAVAVLSYRGSTWGGAPGMAFDAIEAAQVERAKQNAGLQSRSGRTSTGSISGGMVGAVAPPAPAREPNGAMRVGGSIRPPRKILDVPPVYPPDAQKARVQGLVVLEITVGVDGSVTDARVLRSVPMLDQAAIEAVRKWRFEPVLFNGEPVPIILTTTVSFTLQ